MLVRWPVSLALRSDRGRKLKSLQKLENPSHDNRPEKDLALPACYAAEVIHSPFGSRWGALTILLKACLPRLSFFLDQLAYLRVNPLSRRLLWQVQIIDTENRLPVTAGANSHRVTMNIRWYRLR
jgi:hypothetical protein